MIAIIAAISENNVIGNKGKIPWKLPGDLARFKHLTMNHTVVMGRKTYESIVSRLKDQTKEPLKGRRKLVLSHNHRFKAPYCEVIRELDSVLAMSQGEENRLFVIGGAEIYKIFLPLTDLMYLTRVEAEVEGDSFFPEWDGCEWVHAYDPLNMIAETDPRDEYKWHITDCRRL